jgi:outer membrane lipoprotein-sorting protein
MRSRRRNTILAAAAVVAVALVIGIVSVAGAGSSTTLPTVSAEELLAKMAQADGQAQSVSGRVSWKNGLFGNLEMPTGMAQMPAQSPLLSSGSGRLWASEAGVRVESQGSGGDQVAAVSKASRTAWTYDSATNTARRYVMTGAAADAPLPSPSATTLLTPAAIGTYLQRLAPFATVEVGGQTTVAGREAYTLRMTPVAQDTALGVVQAAIDGETMMPLQIEVFARSGGDAVLRFGFDSISYEAVDAALFEFTAPDGAKVTTEEIDPSKMHDQAGAKAGHSADGGQKPTEAEKAAREKLARRALLTLDQAQGLVDYTLASAREYDARPFRWAYVFGEGGPLTAAGDPLFKMAGVDQPSTMGPSTVLLYGSGFGAITLAQTKTTPELSKELEQLPALVETTTAGGSPVRSITTPLGGVSIWQQDGTTLMAGGLVTKADLDAFIATVR